MTESEKGKAWRKRVSNDKYSEGWDRIFGKKKPFASDEWYKAAAEMEEDVESVAAGTTITKEEARELSEAMQVDRPVGVGPVKESE